MLVLPACHLDLDPPHSRGALSSREEALRDEKEIEMMMMKNTVVVAGEQHDRQERELR